MNSSEKFPQWGMNLIIFIPHWGIFTHIMAKFAWNDHRKTQQITPEICQFAFAQAENLTKKWENMQKSWRKTQNRCKRKRKKWRNEGICHPKTGDAGPKTGDAGLKTGDLGTPKKGASPVDALRKTRPNPQHKKWMKTENTTLFEQLLLPKLLPCRFISTFIYKLREKNGIKYW